MSAVRMCDRCGSIFKEGAEDATVGTASRVIRDPYTGQRRTIEVAMDACPTCSGAGGDLIPRLAVTSGPKAQEATVVE